MKTRILVSTDRYEYMGLPYRSIHEVDFVYKEGGRKRYLFKHLGRNWELFDTECGEVKQEECRSSYCECEEGKCSGGKVDMRADEAEKKQSVLDIQHGGSHYKDKGIQPIEYITANDLGFCEGNIVKYASRHQEKNGAEDIRKVIHYAQFILKFQYNEDI